MTRPLDFKRDAKRETGPHALFLRAKGPDDLHHFRIELTNVADSKASQKFIGGGKFLYSYEPANKVVRVFQLAPFKKAVLDRISLLSFILELNADEAKERYDISLTNRNDHNLRVLPKRPSDKGQFTEARISLSRTNYICFTAQIWYHEPNGQEITWNFSKVELDSGKVEPRQFDPQVPAGWRLEGIAPKR